LRNFIRRPKFLFIADKLIPRIQRLFHFKIRTKTFLVHWRVPTEYWLQYDSLVDKDDGRVKKWCRKEVGLKWTADSFICAAYRVWRQSIREWSAFYAFRSKRKGRIEHLSLGRSSARHGGRFQNKETAGHLTVTARRYSGSSYPYLYPLDRRSPTVCPRAPWCRQKYVSMPENILKYSYFHGCSPMTDQWRFLSLSSNGQF
jgi:hypothetical protein